MPEDWLDNFKRSRENNPDLPTIELKGNVFTKEFKELCNKLRKEGIDDKKIIKFCDTIGKSVYLIDETGFIMNQEDYKEVILSLSAVLETHISVLSNRPKRKK